MDLLPILRMPVRTLYIRFSAHLNGYLNRLNFYNNSKRLVSATVTTQSAAFNTVGYSQLTHCLADSGIQAPQWLISSFMIRTEGGTWWGWEDFTMLPTGMWHPSRRNYLPNILQQLYAPPSPSEPGGLGWIVTSKLITPSCISWWMANHSPPLIFGQRSGGCGWLVMPEPIEAEPI